VSALLVPLAFTAALAAQSAADVQFHGFVSTRDQASFPSDHSPLSMKDQPILLSTNELNVQGRVGLLDDKLRFGGDASAFVFFGGVYADLDPDAEGNALEFVDDHEVAALDPFIALSEYWASSEPIEHLVVTVGKKRLTWGPGIMVSPTDLLNPVRDPTDPSLQRAGFLHARVDVPFESVTLTALFAPQVLETNHAIPKQILVDDDDEYHWAAVLRAYVLVAETDLNAWVLATNRYADDLETEGRFAFTLSKSLFLEHEFHAEVLLQQGTNRLYVEPDCVGNERDLVRCALTGRPILDDSQANGTRVMPRMLVGWRWMPADGSMLSFEYLYQADGYLRAEYDDVQRLFGFAGELRRAGVPFAIGGSSGQVGGVGGSSSGEAPTRFAFNAPRRHYLMASYTKPQILDDWTAAASVIVPVEDLSSIVTGSLTWQAQEWLQLSLFAFAPLPSPAWVSAGIDGDPWQAFYESVPKDWRGFVPRGAEVFGVPVGEYDVVPFSARAMFEARAFF
jgi:hypothetical protein